MSLPILAVSVIVFLFLGYHFYGGFVARLYQLDAAKETPALRHADGVDFVPTRPFYLLGQHFSAIAAAGPIAGPIMACQQFGWVPCVLWIAIGVVVIGAVHDFSTLVASVRHDARSIAEVVKVNMGPRAWIVMTAFIWISLVYVVVAFTDVTAGTFVSGEVDLEVRFNQGGAVALAAVLYLVLAVVMGLVDKYLKPPLWLQTLVFVPATLGVVWLGTRFSTLLVMNHSTWALLILAYCVVSSLLPMWLLLQPRGYLGGFVLYIALGVGVIGIFFGGFPVTAEPFKSSPIGAPLFPFLFVTIACGACSGFHGLVCSGTTSKQIARETDCKPVGYGAMLLEGFVALIALSTVMIAAKGAGKPAAIYGAGLGQFLTVIIGKKHLLFATTFGSMAFSTFVFDTLDVSTRLGRYILQELFGWTGKQGAVLATAITCAVPLLFLLGSGPGAYLEFWKLFGTSNQLLAALSLLVITVWLKRTGRRTWYTLYPMIFVMGTTLWSLFLQARAAFTQAAKPVTLINGGISILLLGLALALLFFAVRSLREPEPVPYLANNR